MALPHQVSMTVASDLLDRGLRVVDLSADFRFNDPDLYASVYQPHQAPELLAETVYGLSEIYGGAIAGARLVGNPGCYPTSVTLPLVPLVREGLIETDSIIADAKSGVSGAAGPCLWPPISARSTNRLNHTRWPSTGTIQRWTW